MKGKKNKVFSDLAKERIRLSALTRGHQRQDAVISSVTQAMFIIEQEIKDNSGLYPTNGGALNFNELMRRSGIGLKTLFGEKYKNDFKAKVVDPWLLRIKSAHVSSRKEAKKGLAQRVAEWRDLYQDLLTRHHVSELDLHEAKRNQQELEAAVGALKLENQRLSQEIVRLAKGKIVLLSGK